MTRKTNTIEKELGLLSVEKRTSYGAAGKGRRKGRHNNSTVKKLQPVLLATGACPHFRWDKS